MKRVLVALIVIALLALTACGSDKGSGDTGSGNTGNGNTSSGNTDNGNEPQKTPEPPVGETPNYSINTELLSYIGKTPEEIADLFGDYEGSTWFTGMIFKYGDYWFSFDGDTDYPNGNLSLISCSASDLIDGLGAKADVPALDKLFGKKGNYDANEDGASEWFSEGYVTYGYQGLDIYIACTPDMTIGKKSPTLIQNKNL